VINERCISSQPKIGNIISASNLSGGTVKNTDGGRLSGTPVHVVMIDCRWAVVHSGDLTPLSVHDQRRDAVLQARDIARRDRVEVFDLGGRPLPPDAPDVLP
jgi:hypothetical protein